MSLNTLALNSSEFPKGALPSSLEQGSIRTIGMAIRKHTGVTANEGGSSQYPQGTDSDEEFRIEEGDVVYRYVKGPDSTLDGNPNHVFRALNGMSGGIKVTVAGIARDSYSPQKVTTDNQNPTSQIPLQVGGTGPCVYSGPAASKYTSIYIKQYIPEECTPISLPRKQTQKFNPPVYVPKMMPVSNIRSRHDPVSYIYDTLKRTMDEIISDDPHKGLVNVIGTVEREMLSDSSQIRRHLTDAGLTLAPYSSGHSTSSAPAASQGVVPLGQAFVAYVGEHFHELLELSRILSDPSLVLQECQKLMVYLVHRIGELDRNAIHEDYGHYHTFLINDIYVELSKIVSICTSDEIYCKEWCLLGQLMETVGGPTVNTKIRLATF